MQPPRWVAIAAAALFVPLVILAAFILRVDTPAGTIVLEIDQPELAGAVVSVDGQQKITIKTADSVEPIEVQADEQKHTLQVVKGGFETFTKEFTVKSGKSETIRVRLEKLPAPRVAVGGAADHGKAASNARVSLRETQPPIMSAATGSPSSSPAGYALEFNGKESYVDLPTLRYDGSHPITLEATIMPVQVKYVAAVASNRQTRGPGGGIELGFPVGGQSERISFGRLSWDDSTGSRSLYTKQALEPGQPIHVAGVLQESKVWLFVNGRLQESQDVAENHKSNIVTFLIGARSQTNPPGSMAHFAGIIDELRVSKTDRYTVDFTPQARFEPDADTLALYHFDEGHGDILTDSSGNNHYGKIVNGKWVPGIVGGPP